MNTLFDSQIEAAPAKKLSDIEARVAESPEVPFPDRLHGRIMRRVFIAGYGKYLAACGAVLIVNISVLGADLYRALTSSDAIAAFRRLGESWAVSPAYLASVTRTLYDVLPVQSLVVTMLSIGFSAYIGYVFMRAYRDPARAQALVAGLGRFG